MTGKSPREIALNVLCGTRIKNGFASDVLAKATEGLEQRDAAFCYHLTLCVLQNRRFIDAAIDRFTKGKMEPLVRDILRLGAAQLLFMRVPENAAVHETVNQAKAACPRAAGLCNAVLRRLSETDRDSLLEAMGGSFALRYSLPDWLAEELIERFGAEEAQSFAAAVSQPPPVTLVENTFRPLTEREKLPLTCHEALPGVYTYDGAVERLTGFIRGKVLVADAGARMAVMALGLRPGMRVWDGCAAPGGKSLMAALDMKNEGYVLSTDVSEKKLPKIEQSAARMGVEILDVHHANAAVHEPGECFDAVICDVPCSGLGVLAKKPDIRFKSPGDFARLPEVQGKILCHMAKYVAPGGLLLYCTCTFRRAENEDVVNAFLTENPDFKRQSFTLPMGEMDEITLLPHVHGTDSFYFTLLKKGEAPCLTC